MYDMYVSVLFTVQVTDTYGIGFNCAASIKLSVKYHAALLVQSYVGSVNNKYDMYGIIYYSLFWHNLSY